MNEPDLQTFDGVLSTIRIASLALKASWGQTTSGKLRGCVNGAICCPLSLIYLHRTGKHLSPRTRLWKMVSELGIPRHLAEICVAAADLREIRGPMGQWLPDYEEDVRIALESVTIAAAATPYARIDSFIAAARSSNQRPKPVISLKERQKEFLPETGEAATLRRDHETHSNTVERPIKTARQEAFATMGMEVPQ